jgi:hypothetical protein
MFFASGADGNTNRRMLELETPLLMRAFGIERSGRATPSTVQPRNNPPAAQQVQPWPMPTVTPISEVRTKAQFINFIRNANSGSRADCSERYDIYTSFFQHDPTLSGQITARTSGPTQGRLDHVCEFLSFAHWCFALGFAFDIRDADDPIRANTGSRCLTYQEFCTHRGRTFDPARVDDYLSRVIDEILFYNNNIRNTSMNTVAVTTETRQGNQVVSSTSWRVHNTDSWVKERIPPAEKTRLLCR